MNNSDKKYMQMTLELAAKARGKTSPNPMVGAVIVKSGRIIAADYHRKAGTPHAEALALIKAGVKAKGATLYVNLEPCCHTQKRTPPCTDAIIKYGIKEVVIAMVDPNPYVSGMGMKILRKAGIRTRTGALKHEAQRLNEMFIKYIIKNEPFVTLKMAQSLDGKIATARGESKWITGPQARNKVHKMRREVDAILTGIGTVVKDNPSLDCRISRGKNPYRIIVDSSLRIPLSSKVLRHNDGRTIIATTSRASDKKINAILNGENQILVIKQKKGRVDLKKLMKELGKLEISSLLIEGGASISASALSAGIIDKVMFFSAPKIIGGIDSIPSVGGSSPARLSSAIELKDLKVTAYGRDFLIEGYPDYKNK
jgi:diaminohydroxyphosphoribosylaminopyrimidine deaminase/5-amino-6-(5-phosphoribosylamino)uracil reductase